VSIEGARDFFYTNAGYSYDPKTETAEQGRMHGAMELAKAERWARENGYTYVWEDDGCTEVQRDDGTWEQLPAVGCAMHAPLDDSQWRNNPIPCQSLGGITESDDASERRAYRRVVEAELALEELHMARVADAAALED